MGDRSRRLSVWSLGLVLLFAVGCASERAMNINERLTSLAEVSKKPPNALYVVDPPDSIRVEFVNEPQLTRNVQLRSDGRVTLPHVRDVEVAGLTTEEIRRKLEKEYAKFYKEPELLVSVSAYRSKHIYVYGEVGRQGVQPYTGSQFVSDAIGTAGGITRRSAPGRVRVIRGDPDDPEIYRVDLDRLILEGDTLQDVSLAENDVVYVPPNALAWLGYQVDALLWPFRGVLGFFASARAVQQ